MLKAIIESKGYKTGIIGTIQNMIGDEVFESANTTPDAYALNKLFAQMRDAGCQYVIMEASSHALDQKRIYGLDFEVAAFTNLTQDHLDFNKDMDEYLESKKNLYKYQTECDFLVTNFDNEITRGIYPEAPGNTRLFSRKTDTTDLYVNNNSIYYKDEKIIDKNEILLPGEHNVENYMAAIGATFDYVSVDTIVHVAKTFAKIPHRIEFIREFKGVKYYNDSIASSPSRAIAGLNSFSKKVIMIAGGYDKNLDYSCLGDIICSKVKQLVLIGATSKKIKDAVTSCSSYKNACVEISEATSFENALYLAKESAKEGDIVILCPASASFDMFENFEQRGNIFKELVNNLSE
jgi:UDP-N-acetylmuramoylalanine--D-glutamate ligase